MASTDEVLKKVSKLLALGNGSVQGEEAKTALQMAYKLLEENDLSISEVIEFSQLEDKKQNLGDLGEQIVNNDVRQYRAWEVTLLNAMAKLFDCVLLSTPLYPENCRIKKSIKQLAGREGNRRSAELMYNWLKDKTVKEARDNFKHVHDRYNYCNGVANAIYQKVTSMKPRQDVNVYGLVPLDEVNTWLKKQYPQLNMINRHVKSPLSKSYTMGYGVGESTSLNRQFGLKAITAR